MTVHRPAERSPADEVPLVTADNVRDPPGSMRARQASERARDKGASLKFTTRR